MAEVIFVLNQLRDLDPARARAFEDAIREAVGLHRGRYEVRILVGTQGNVSVRVEQPALPSDASVEVTGVKLIGTPARAWPWSSPVEAQTPDQVRDALAMELRNRVRGKSKRVPLTRKQKPMYRSKHRPERKRASGRTRRRPRE